MIVTIPQMIGIGVVITIAFFLGYWDGRRAGWTNGYNIGYQDGHKEGLSQKTYEQ